MSPSPTPPASGHEANIERIVTAVLRGESWGSVRLDDRGPTLDEAEEALTVAVERLRGVEEALLSLVVERAQPSLGGVYRGMGPEHRMWMRVGEWKAGAETPDGAREALKDVIRAALIEQTGETDAR